MNLIRYRDQLKIKKEGDKTTIFDPVRKKYVEFTPEEMVRQCCIQYLKKTLNYPYSLISVETGLKYNTLQKRSDIVIFRNDLKPFILIECKSFKESINTSVLEQALLYNHTLKADFVCVTNGITSKVLKVKEAQFIDELPLYT